MSSFTDSLTLTYLTDLDIWETDREFTYFIGSEDSDLFVTVPVGFKTDLASVPWPFTNLIPKSGKFNQSAVLHDYLYFTKKFMRKAKQENGILHYPIKVNRKACDDVFLQSMKVLGVSLWKRTVMYNAVRAFGWACWKNK